MSADDPTLRERIEALRPLSDSATVGKWRQESYRDGEMLPDGTGSQDDYETPGAGVYVIDEASDEGYCLTEFHAGRSQDAEFIVAAVNTVRAVLAEHAPADDRAEASDDENAREHKERTLARFAPANDPTDVWCREESCHYRYWQSGDMPTHRRGSECPMPADDPTRQAAAQALRDAAEAARGMHDPASPECAEWADWLDARADRLAATPEDGA